MSNDAINPAGTRTEVLPASTPEYAPATQTIVEDIPAGEVHTVTVESPPTTPLPGNKPYVAPREPEPQPTPTTPSPPIPPVAPAHPPTLSSAPTPASPVMPVIPASPVAPVSPVTPVSPISPVMPATPAHPISPTATPADALPAFTPSPPASPEKRLYDLLLEEFSHDPRFELHTNVRALMQEVQSIKAITQHTNAPAAMTNDLAAIRETVERIWTQVQGTGNREQGTEETPSAIGNRQSAIPSTPNTQYPTPELISETRALVRSVNEEVNATRNNVIQLTNQGRMMLDVATRCLREMDKTAQKYEQQGETGALLDELRSLRDMLADGFENARLEPIAPASGEPFRYSDHRADNGFASSGKIKRTVFAGFRWTQPNPPVVLLPAIVETE